ncbi:50S ribosomal protein L18 [Vulcanococcus sp. Clear-D1]|jgi:large subunit ribosomal protein L18|uniref:50S ribosomal protein L18 n=1 Tax=Vulcanococcus sp. Clear-D1 TaxID=2766970 RepID=UPI0019B6F73E|nr:50S ribosomal protein L18 [Vulcanococcus sp. Clear-D1]MBD1193012.1 50S ribosomal protein L18 [Vulcanococcus sp. Clear-D1]
MSTLSRKQQTQKRHRRLRRNLSGTAARPRLAVFRSNNHIYAQVIDDHAQSTLCSASTVDKELRSSVSAGATCDASVAVGQLVAKRALAKGIQQVVFDRGGNLYHGRVKALADAAREAGLQF